MSRAGAWTLLVALSLPGAALAQGVDPDLLDPDLGDDLLDAAAPAQAAPLPAGVAVPAAPQKDEVDGVAAGLRRDGDAVGQELHHELYDLASQDGERAAAEVARRIEALESEVSSIRGEVAALMEEQGGIDLRRGGRRGYGGPVEVGRGGRRVVSAREALVDARFDADPLGRPMWSWWEALLNATCRNVPDALHPLAEHRVNAMKVQADRTALKVAPHLRPYVDHGVRAAVLASNLGRFALEPPHDRRLEDLFTLGGNKRGNAEQRPTQQSRPLDIDLPVEAVEVKRLPRDPATGQPVIDYPLGVPVDGSER